MSEARRYQQLRGHLSYLKLDTAADALPRVLDQARAENLSMTAALERLLEIEVNATEERRLADRLRFACLPDPWTLADFDFAAQPGVDEKLIRDLATLRFLDDIGHHRNHNLPNAERQNGTRSGGLAGVGGQRSCYRGVLY